MDLKDILVNVGSLLVLGLLISSLSASLNIRRFKTVKNVSIVRLTAGLCNSSLWVNYALLLGNANIYRLHTVGILIHIFQMGCYYAFAPDEKFMHKLFAFVGLGLFTAISYTSYLSTPEHGTFIAGLLSSTSLTLFVASSLVNLVTKTVIKTKSTATLPFSMICLNLTIAALFSTYGYLLNNLFIQIPSVINLCTSSFALSLFAIYPLKQPKKVDKKIKTNKKTK